MLFLAIAVFAGCGGADEPATRTFKEVVTTTPYQGPGPLTFTVAGDQATAEAPSERRARGVCEAIKVGVYQKQLTGVTEVRFDLPHGSSLDCPVRP